MLVAIVLPFVMRAISGAAQVGVYADRKAQAQVLADTKLSEIIVTRAWEQGDDAGEFDPTLYGTDAEKYQWLVLIDDWENVSFNQVTVIVTWTQRGQEQSVSLGTVVYAEQL